MLKQGLKYEYEGFSGHNQIDRYVAPMPGGATCRQDWYLISSDSETITSYLLTDIL